MKSFGAAVIDADRIARQVVEQNPNLLKRLVKQFGTDILTSGGKLSRKKLAGVAFADQQSRLKLNRLIHPFVLKVLRKQLSSLKKTHELVVIDAPLLLDANLDRVVDAVLLVHASESKRLDRLKARGISRDDALARQRQQLSYTEQRQRSNYVILNNQSEPQLEQKLKQVLFKLRRKTVDL